MRKLSTSFLLLGVLTAARGDEPPSRTPPDRPATRPARGAEAPAGGKKGGSTAKGRKPKFPLGKETTYVSGPLDKDGYVDYEAALNDQLGKGITPENNANALLWKALGPAPEGQPVPPEFFKRLGIKAPPERGDYFLSLVKYLRDRRKVGPRDKAREFYDRLDRAARRPWAAKEDADLADWLKANDRPLALVAEATRCPHYFNPLVRARAKEGASGLVNAPQPGVQKCRELALVLAARAMLRAGEGQPDGAWRDLLACHRLGRLVARGGTLVEGLVGIGIDRIASEADVAFLAHSKLGAKSVRACLRDLRALPAWPATADKVDLAERFEFLDSVVQLDRQGKASPADVAGGAKGEHGTERIDWGPALRNANRWFDRMAAALRLEDRSAREKEFDRIEKELRKLTEDARGWGGRLGLLFLGKDRRAKAAGERVGNVLIALLVPAVRKAQSAADRAEQVQGNLHVAFALAAYRADHGRYPGRLAALSPKYLAEVPGDLFSRKGLVYRPSREGYLLYSVGANGRDDEGRGYGDDPPGDDLAVRMPPPRPRRK